MDPAAATLDRSGWTWAGTTGGAGEKLGKTARVMAGKVSLMSPGPGGPAQIGAAWPWEPVLRLHEA